MRNEVLAAIEKYAMLPPGDRVTVGLSGGADSVALLHFLLSVSEQYGVTVDACHINHNLRGAESARDEAFVIDLTARWGVKLRLFSEDMLSGAKEAKLSVEEYARKRRYALLELAAAGGKIATGHNLNDRAETLLFNLARGTSVSGLSSIPAKRGNIIRPLILATREQIEGYCAENGLAYITDSSNLTDHYARNRIRHHVLPTLYEINGGLYQNLAKFFAVAGDENDFLDGLAKRALDESREGKGFLAEKLAPLPIALKRRTAVLLLKEYGFSQSFDRVEEVTRLLGTGNFKLGLEKDRYLMCKDGVILPLQKEEDFPYFEIPAAFQWQEIYAGVFARLREIEMDEMKKNEKIYKNYFLHVADCDRIAKNAVFRQKRVGDSISLFKRGVTKPLKKLFSEAKLPIAQRQRLLVLAAGDDVLWVEGFGIDRRVAPDENTASVAVIEVRRGALNDQ